MENKIIKLKKVLGAMAIVLFSIGHAQMTLEGTVKSAEGYPETDASVSVGGKDPVFTDVEGRYSLTIQPNQAKNGKVEISVEGITGAATSKTVVFKNGTTSKTDFVLGGIALDEIVTVGYYTAKKSDLSGAVVSFKPEESLAATTNSIADLLQGQASGVSINTGGSTPGAASSVIIRGANSLKGDSQPLYVIDNVPQSSTGQTMASTANDFQLAQDPLAGINPNDIEDIQILKDASATAIYGSRGANGVILITTKRGKEGDARITFTSNLYVSSAVRLMKTMNLREYADFYNKYQGGDTTSEIIMEGGKFFYRYNSSKGEVPYRDWMREALQTSFSQDYNINANGGGKKVRYNLSAGYKDIKGIVRKTGFRHGDFRANINADLNDKLKLNLTASAFLRKNNMMPGGNPYGGRAAGGIMNAALIYKPFEVPEDSPDFEYDENRTTVFSWLNDYEDISNEYRYSLSADLRYKITPHLSYTFRTGGNLNNVERKNWYGLQLTLGGYDKGYLGVSILDRNNYNVENILNYNRTFGKTNVALTAGATYDVYTWLNTRMQGSKFPYMLLGVNGMHLANTIKIHNPNQQDYQLLSFLGRANVSFSEGKYILTSTLRADGTSKFEKSRRWGYFPSFAAAWNIKDEDFLQDVTFLNQLKLRAGYGETGSQGISPYQTFGIFADGTGYADADRNQLRGLGVGNLNNPDLLWESTSSYNAGADFAMFRSRVRGTVDVYTKSTNDLLIDIDLPLSSAFQGLSTNRGSVYNKGIEGNIDIDVVKTQDFIWSVGGNISFNESHFEGVKSFRGGEVQLYFGQPNIFIPGRAPGLFYGYKTDGIVQKSEEKEYIKSFELGDDKFSSAGNIKILDVNNDGKINREDETVIGDPNPDFTYGLQTNISYKGVKLSASFTGVKGGDILNTYARSQNMASFTTGTGNKNPEATANAWTEENPNDFYPKLRSRLLDKAVIDRYIESGSYFRCTDITLGYDLPRDILKEIKMDRIRFYLSVKNAFTITNYTGFDVTNRSYGSNPIIRGVDRYSFPSQRTFIFGGSFTF